MAKPVLFNEDDHFDFDRADYNFLAALGEYASWGYFDPYADGFQSPPVTWSLNTERKRAFFAAGEGDHGYLTGRHGTTQLPHRRFAHRELLRLARVLTTAS